MNQPTLVLMDGFLPAATDESAARLRSVSPEFVRRILEDLAVSSPAIDEAVGNWTAFQADSDWCNLLARLVTMVERDRGNLEAPLPIWDDLDDAGQHGRLLYVYLVALCAPGLVTLLTDQGVPAPTVRLTLSALERHNQIHVAKWGSFGVDAGWWLLILLRGELLHIGSLQFHRLKLGRGILAPHPWYSEVEQVRRGEGFVLGDDALGVHIPVGADLCAEALDATFAQARDVLGGCWPSPTRRLATCQSWMMDDRLVTALGERSRLVGFQRRFELLPDWQDDRDNVLEFVFRQPTVALEALTASSRLQAFVLEVLRSGDAWRDRTGWLDFDGPVSTPGIDQK